MQQSDLDKWIEENYPEIDPEKLVRPENTGEPVTLDYRYVKPPKNLKCENCNQKNFKCLSISKIETKAYTRVDKLFQCQHCGKVITK